MAFTADAIIANIESRLGWSGVHVWDFYKLAKGTPWCSGEVSYTFNKTGNKAKIFGGKPVFYVPTAQEWMAKHWETVYDYRTKTDLTKVRKGDAVVFMWARGSRDHIGFARATATATELYSVEGNTNGGNVANRTRAKKYILGVYRPPYDGSTKPEKTAQNKKQPVKKQETTVKTPSYKVGNTYTVQVDCLAVRTGPGVKYKAKAKKDLTKDGQKRSNAKGQLMKGTRVTCQAVNKNNGNVWIRIPSGWIAGYYQKKTYVK